MFSISRVLLITLLILSFASPVQARTRKHQAHSTHTSSMTARSAILWNATSNKVYFSKNSKTRVFPASTTKVMTVLLALENLQLDQYVTVSAGAAQVQQTNLGFRAGEQYKVRDLVYACLLKSANDAAGVLAEAVGGTQERFVNMMNQKAVKLGAYNTRFVNPHGLPSPRKQYTTAKDMAIILKGAIKDPFFQKAISLRYRIIYSKDGRRHFLKSHNKSLFLDWKQDIFGKTGYTRQARSCFVGFFRKGNDIFIVDVFGCRNKKRWDDIKWIIERHGKMDL